MKIEDNKEISIATALINTRDNGLKIKVDSINKVSAITFDKTNETKTNSNDEVNNDNPVIINE